MRSVAEFATKLTAEFPVEEYKNKYGLSSHYFTANEMVPEKLFYPIRGVYFGLA